MRKKLYRVLHINNDGRESLTKPMPYDEAERQASDLAGRGFVVGSVTDVEAARAALSVDFKGGDDQ
jgi:hypothetical protein